MDVDRSLDEIIESSKQDRRERRLSEKDQRIASLRTTSVRNIQKKTPYQRQPTAGEMARANGNASARIYVHNLPYSHTWRDLKDYFAQSGNVVRADIMTDRATHRSRGCGLVEFATAEEAQNAIETLNDSEIEGRKILVREDRERGDKPVAAIGRKERAPVDPNSHVGRQVFVNNLDKSITWQDLKDAFSPAGEVERADIIGDGRLSKGQGLILFKTAEAAQRAIEEYHEGELKNKTISVKMDTKVGQYVRPTGTTASTGIVSQRQVREPREQRGPAAVSKRVYVHNLPYSVQSEDLQAHFESEEAVVVGAEVMRMSSGRSKGCGIVEFETVAMAALAIETLNNSPLDGRNILVREDRETGRKEATPASAAPVGEVE